MMPISSSNAGVAAALSHSKAIISCETTTAAARVSRASASAFVSDDRDETASATTNTSNSFLMRSIAVWQKQGTRAYREHGVCCACYSPGRHSAMYRGIQSRGRDVAVLQLLECALHAL